MTDPGSPRDPNADAEPTLPANPPGGSDPPGNAPHSSGLPARIAGYTVRRRIASGGMGTIYEGIQEQPRRPVAIKVMRRGVVSPEALRRFQYESQILARLRHPGIAQVYEAGTYLDGEDSLPFFAMEYIPNAKPITRFAKDKKLPVAERLELFARVCDAVHYGHQKGIIHRDLKPSNILVDSQGHPRIIDFGVARATDSDLALATFQTEVGQIIGSLQYMSPEQFDADPHDIDTRSDVYALGVILYELLRGEPPYDVSGTAIHEAARIVREQGAPRLGADRPALRGDIETIVHKALEKDRDQRYQSAFGLAQDIRRSLAGDSITARPPSISYQMRVFARKHKAVLASVAAAFAVLVAGVIVSTSFWFRAEGQREVAEREAAKAEAATEFMRDMLAESIPRGFGDDVTIAQMLDLSREKASVAFPDEPEVEADVCRSVGWGYLNLARWEDAAQQWKRSVALRSQALGRDHAKTLESLEDLALAYRIMGEHEEGTEALRWRRDSTARVHGEDHPDALSADYFLAVSLVQIGELAEAEELARRAAETRARVLGEDHGETIDARTLLAGIRLYRGDAAGSEASSRKLLARAEAALGPEHFSTRTARSQLGAALVAQGKLTEAEALYASRGVPEDFGLSTRFQGDFDPDAEGAQVLVFWETWCPFSVLEVPELEKLYRGYSDRGINVVGLSKIDRSATEEGMREFLAEKDISFPILRMDYGPWESFGVPGTPWVVVIRNGRMVWENFVDTPDGIPRIMMEGLADGI